MFKKMALHIGSVSFVLALIMLFASLSSIMLGRTMTPTAFGQFSLMRTLLLFIGALSIWGQDVAAARFFSQNGIKQFKWSQALRLVVGVGSVLALIGVLIAGFIYRIHWDFLLVLFIALIGYIATLFLSNLMRSQAKYSQAILMLNGFRGLFFIAALVIFLFKVPGSSPAIFSYYGIIIILAIVNIKFALSSLPQGEQPIPREMHTTGLLFMGSQASVAIIGSLDSLFIPGLLDLPSLALYQAAVVPSQLFNIIGRAGKYVWIPEFGRSKNIKMKRLSLIVGVVAVSLLVLLIIYARPLLHLLFNGKYDAGANVLRILAVAGAIRLFYNLASSIIIGKLQKDALYWHLGVTITMMLIEVGLLIYMLKSFGVMGAALTVLIVISLRTVASFFIINKFKHQLTAAA
jgi:O-antigen/teichoic acid export membrane protein